MPSNNTKISSRKLFTDFLLIGATAFGGFMALISVVEKQMVEKRAFFRQEDLLDTITVASILPGPMAVNVVTALGYKLKGMRGAMLSMVAILLPTYLFILLLSWLYFDLGNLIQADSIFQGIVPAVCAIILSVGLNMSKKNLTDYKLIMICFAACVIYIFIGGFFITLILMLVGGILARLWYFEQDVPNEQSTAILHYWSPLLQVFSENKIFFAMSAGVVGISLFSMLLLPDSDLPLVLARSRALFLTFGGVSLTLFGGGYVFIPMLQELTVNQLAWVSSQEFVDGIAMGQVTPGPIMISAAFIGFKQAGVLGSLIATIAMFMPPAILMVLVSSLVSTIKQSRMLQTILKGVRATVIGMIFAAAWVLAQDFLTDWVALSIMTLVFILTFSFKVNVIYLIPLSGLLGYLIY